MFDNKGLLIKRLLTQTFVFDHVWKVNLGIWSFINEIHSIANPGSVLVHLFYYEEF